MGDFRENLPGSMGSGFQPTTLVHECQTVVSVEELPLDAGGFEGDEGGEHFLYAEVRTRIEIELKDALPFIPCMADDMRGFDYRIGSEPAITGHVAIPSTGWGKLVHADAGDEVAQPFTYEITIFLRRRL